MNLKQARNNVNITQEEVALRLHISRAAYTNIENGKRDPDTKTLCILADMFNVSVDYLLGRPETSENEKTIANEDDSLKKEILSLWDSLNPDSQKSALNYLRFLSNDKETK